MTTFEQYKNLTKTIEALEADIETLKAARSALLKAQAEQGKEWVTPEGTMLIVARGDTYFARKKT